MSFFNYSCFSDGWHRPSVGSNYDFAMSRYKRVLGLHARTLPTQKTEVACKVINIVTALGMPVSRRIA